jgi:hypothetical protein
MDAFKDLMWWVEEEIFWIAVVSERGLSQLSIQLLVFLRDMCNVTWSKNRGTVVILVTNYKLFYLSKTL